MTMKKSVKAVLASLGMVAAVGFAPNASAVTWTLSPDANTLAFGVTVVPGLNEVNFADSASQPQGIFGAGFTFTGPAVTVNFDSDLYSWDSYNAVGSGPGGTGYFDAFIVTISSAGYYWNSSPSDPQLASASQFVWGGTNYSDGVLESYITAPGFGDTISASGGGPSTTWYVSVVLDTASLPHSDTAHPSYGSFHVSAVPEPETYAMFLAGLGLMGFMARRRSKTS